MVVRPVKDSALAVCAQVLAIVALDDETHVAAPWTFPELVMRIFKSKVNIPKNKRRGTGVSIAVCPFGDGD